MLSDIYLVLISLYGYMRWQYGHDIWQIALLSEGLIYWMLPVFLVFFVMLLLNAWIRVGIALAGVAVYLIMFGPVLLDIPRLPAGNTVTVLTYNAGQSLTEPEALRDLIEDTDADLVGLQEITPAHLQSVAGMYPHEAAYNEEGYALLSRYPIVDAQNVPTFQEEDPSVLHTWIDLDGVLTSVMVVRFKAPRLGSYVTGYGYHIWPNSDRLLERVGSGPTIIMGDLNATDQNENVTDFYAAGLTDAHRAGGWGFGATFPARTDGWRSVPRGVPPLLRIDYVFVSEEIDVVRTYTGKRAGSDHLPVIARLKVAGE
ncbi:MAG: endonuclease/exonuclease/phosphatase family protein [Anaerolineae bacterium]